MDFRLGRELVQITESGPCGTSNLTHLIIRFTWNSPGFGSLFPGSQVLGSTECSIPLHPPQILRGQRSHECSISSTEAFCT